MCYTVLPPHRWLISLRKTSVRRKLAPLSISNSSTQPASVSSLLPQWMGSLCSHPGPLTTDSHLLLSTQGLCSCNYLFSLLNDQFSSYSISASQPRVILHPPRNIWQCLGTCFVVMTSGGMLLGYKGVKRAKVEKACIRSFSFSTEIWCGFPVMDWIMHPTSKSTCWSPNPTMWLYLETGTLGRLLRLNEVLKVEL